MGGGGGKTLWPQVGGNASEAESSDGFVAEASLFICLTRERLSIHCLQDSHVGHAWSRSEWAPLSPNEK